MIWRLTILLYLVAILNGCAAGKAVMIQPKDSATEYTCGSYLIRPGSLYADGFVVVYYVVPLVPLSSASKTQSSLELPITIQSLREPVFDLTLQDVQVRLPGTDVSVSPTHVEIMDENTASAELWYQPYRKTFKFTFDIDRHELSEFSLIFPQPIQGCRLPDTAYERKVERYLATPVNR